MCYTGDQFTQLVVMIIIHVLIVTVNTLAHRREKDIFPVLCPYGEPVEQETRLGHSRSERQRNERMD